jgi:crotonobetainyl-CoA:carnitine CoA-transferase CaiB-like acyl-CoA transferase
VLKVEDTGMGDYIRWSPPYYEGAEDSSKSALFLSLNRGKRSIRLNLKHEQGKQILLKLVREYDVVLESFRPGVLDRLGVGYERMREENPGIVYCAISGYGQDGPNRDRSGHDMNYLGLIGLLGLTGERDGPPVQAAGQIADLGGGALMAAFGIMAALRERDRSGEGQMVDVSMADGALSWLAMVAAQYFADDAVPKRGGLPLAGSLVCYRPYACSDGYVTLGALEPKFWQAWCRGVGREDLIEKQFEAPGSEAHGEVERIFLGRTRDDWTVFAAEHDCCLEPVLDLDEALASDLVREREMVVELDQPGVDEPVRLLGVPIKLSRTPGAPQGPGPALGEDTREVLLALGYSGEEAAALVEDGAVAGPPKGAQGSFLA